MAQETGEQFGVLIIRAIYRNSAPHETPEERRENLMGYALGVFRVGALVESSVSTLPEETVNIKLVDEASAVGERLLYLRRTSPGDRPIEEEELEDRDKLFLRAPLAMPGRQWSLLISPTPEFLGIQASWGVLAGGLLITALLVAYLISMINHAAKIERLAATLTKSNEELEREITERKQAKAVLQESEERYRTLVDLSPDAINVVREGKYVYVNPSGAKLFGAATAEELVGRPVLDFVHPDHRAMIGERIRQIKEQGQPVDPIVAKGLRLDGQVIEVEGLGAPIVYQGKPAVQVVMRDVTQRKRAEEENRRLALAVANASDGVIITGMDGRISFVNRAAVKMYGYDPGEMLGMNFFDLHPESFRETTAREIFEATRNEGSWTGEVPLLNKSGEEFHVRLSTALMKDDEGHARGMVGIATDVTERRQLQAQLVQAQKMDAIGRLAGGVAHDFNNLLTVIIGYSYLGQTGPQTGEGGVRASFMNIQKAAERASELTQKLLAFSRHQVVEPKVISLSELILDMDGMLRRLISEDIELVTLPAADSGMVRIDPGQMEQCLTNLAVNARDAMPDGGKLVIKTSNVSLDQEYAGRHPGANTGDYVVLAVTDTGIGMTEEVMSHVFEPYFTTKGVGEGTGLGLSTCYGIVSMLGGYIDVKSRPGQGSTFEVYLPRVDEPASQAPVRDKSDELPLGTETVFLVEDEPLVRSMASLVLRERGYTVVESTNGVEALRVAKERGEEEIHLLLTDVVMPQMGGSELAERLRTQHPETRVLFTSGYTDEAVVRPDPLQNGADFIKKPFTPAALALKVREVLDR